MIQEHERKVLEQFRKEVMDEGIVSPGDTIGTDDDTLLRFLRSRKLHIGDAKKMVANCQEWRRTVEGIGIDALYNQMDPLDYPKREIVTHYWPIYNHKLDKEGLPIHIQGLGQLDINALLREVDQDLPWKAFLTNSEFVTREVYPACSRVKGTPVSTGFCLVDLKGFSISKFWAAKSYLKTTVQNAQDYYPETTGKLVIINAPSTFTFCWSVIKLWLSPETLAKVIILGSDYQSVLLEHIDKENLPTEYGGACKCEAFGGCLLSNDGPWLEGRVFHGHGPSKYKAKLQEPEKQ